ncbi:hypothetical protein OIU79_028640 [Salix purpurea]|uniref:Uncharacterized protein n=1 Tax=Salix purpurea TaxID=77065 RepID=A0A9Q0VWG0_SALPP|nr:hypothetical protein OIU79_028640 [Salix purpurea]
MSNEGFHLHTRNSTFIHGSLHGLPPVSVALFLISSPSADAISLFTAFSTIFDVTISSRRAQSFTTIPILRTFVIRTVFLG